MFKTQKTILLIIFFIVASFTKVSAIEPDVFIQSTVNRAAETLGGGLSKKKGLKN